MTLQELGEMQDEVLTPEQVAPIIRLNPHSIRIAAKENPTGLGFPVIRAGTRVKIPRLAFLEYMGYRPDAKTSQKGQPHERINWGGGKDMMLEEVQARLKKEKITTQDQLWALNSLYLLLDLHKDDFCKIVDAVGLETLIAKQCHYDRLLEAENELAAKERYLRAKARLEELEAEKQGLEQVVNNYNPFQN